MDRDKPSFPDALRALRERSRHRLAEHPTVEALAAYHEDRVSPAEQEALREHLTLCSECRGLVLDLARFDELGRDEEGEPVGRDLDSAWDALRSRLKPLPARREAPRRAGGGWRSWSPARARLAAGLFLAIFAFASGWTAARFEGSSDFRVQADVKQISLSPEQEIPRGGDSVESIPRGRRFWTLILYLPAAANDREYEARVERDGTKVLHKLLHEEKDEGFLSLGMECRSCRPGEYQVLLFSPTSPQQPIATYSFKVQR
jgi:Putative zinc-finger